MENPISPLILGFASGFLLLAVLTLTSFVKISVVFMIIRQSLGLQQVPNNMVIMTLAAFLATFISMPVFSQSLNAVAELGIDPSSPQALFDLWNAGISPFQGFIAENIDREHLVFFIQLSNDLWEGSGLVGTEEDFIIQVPAFMISELTEAFRIGFLIYLPFVSIDLAVTGILMAMGMQQVQPNIIAVPFKLLTFIFVDGWSRLVEGLVMTYVV